LLLLNQIHCVKLPRNQFICVTYCRFRLNKIQKLFVTCCLWINQFPLTSSHINNFWILNLTQSCTIILFSFSFRFSMITFSFCTFLYGSLNNFCNDIHKMRWRMCMCFKGTNWVTTRYMIVGVVFLWDVSWN
jgi:hypothetical protein